MAVHVEYPDGTRQWLPMNDHCAVYRAHDGITIAPSTSAKSGHIDLPSGSQILARAPNGGVVEWRRYRARWGLWPIYCEGAPSPHDEKAS